MLPLTRSRNRSRFFGIPFSPSVLFEGGTVAGAWYDPSDLSTMFDTSAGTTPVAMPGLGSAVPVGLMLDKSVPVAATGNYSGFFSGYGANVADNAAFTLGSADFTIECWVKANSVASRQALFYQIDNGGSNALQSFALEITAASKWHFMVVSGATLYSAISTASAITDWTHIAAVRAGNTLTLYVNGVADGTANVTGVTVNDSAQLLKFGNFTTAAGGIPYTGYISNFRIVKGAAVYTGNFTPPTSPLTAISGTSFLTFQNNYFKDNSTNALAVNVTTASANLLNPFDATAARTINNAIAFNNTTARPELRARVNLLTYSEEFDNGAWSKTAGGASLVTPNTVTAPDGTMSADTLTANNSGSVSAVTQSNLDSYITGVVETFSVYAKKGTSNFVVVRDLRVNQNLANTNRVWFDLANGVVGTQQSAVTGSIIDVGNGWYKCSITGTVAVAVNRVDVQVADADGSDAVAQGNYIYIWGADLRPANIGANVPAYQRIADANTYDTSGFPLYLRFDGIDDSMYTPANLNLSSTDKVAVFAGVRKLSDAASATVTELSADAAVNNGAFVSSAPGSSGANSYQFISRGTTLVVAGTGVTNVAPTTNVVTNLSNISGDSAIVRVNGTQAAINTGDQGTGNFGTYPLYIGARNNSIFWFNGHLHSLIIAGSAVSAGNISATEQWVAQKTGIAI